MASTYAGILGPLAFLTSLGHGAIHGSNGMSVLWTGWCCLVVFAAVGYVVGWIAERIVEDSVPSRITAELAVRQEAKPSRPTVAEGERM